MESKSKRLIAWIEYNNKPTCYFCRSHERFSILYDKEEDDQGLLFNSVTLNFCPMCGKELFYYDEDEDN